MALAWIGRGTFGPEDLDEAVETARNERVNATSRYLIGMPLLADYLEEGWTSSASPWGRREHSLSGCRGRPATARPGAWR